MSIGVFGVRRKKTAGTAVASTTVTTDERIDGTDATRGRTELPAKVRPVEKEELNRGMGIQELWALEVMEMGVDGDGGADEVDDAQSTTEPWVFF